ncbi:MAG: hypothetical protein HY909_10015 [Deltaproteobacteria bacterium]|nr:hypothetical protein [Deltaproteobacteria bacterium]
MRWSHRFEEVEASVHWAHLTAAVDLEVTESAPGRAAVRLTVWDFGDYWDTDFVPRSRTLDLTGTLEPAREPVRVTLDPPAPFGSLMVPAEGAVTRWYVGPGLSPKPPPEFWQALWSWARDAWKADPPEDVTAQ